MERAESNYRLGLQTRELVVPSRDSNWQDMFRQKPQSAAPASDPNTLIYGDNLLAMAALLAGSDSAQSLRSKVDLIYIDPPYDSKADYRTKISLSESQIEQRPTTIEQFAYSDTWVEGTASYLSMLVPRLVLMRELLSERGSIYVHLDWHVNGYVRAILDEVFGKQNFRNEIIWTYFGFKRSTTRKFPQKHDTIYSYFKNEDYYWKTQYKPHSAEYLNPHSPSKSLISLS